MNRARAASPVTVDEDESEKNPHAADRSSGRGMFVVPGLDDDGSIPARSAVMAVNAEGSRRRSPRRSTLLTGGAIPQGQSSVPWGGGDGLGGLECQLVLKWGVVVGVAFARATDEAHEDDGAGGKERADFEDDVHPVHQHADLTSQRRGIRARQELGVVGR